ncbi:Putative F-box/LRR-repeat protein At5g02700 [Linum grandiflorum]
MKTCEIADRLSNLPDTLIHHILSFLDTKSAVKTSSLSKQWKHAWKEVQVLDIRAEHVGYDLGKFESYVDKVLSLRYPLISINKVPNMINTGEEGERLSTVLADIIKYASSHDTRHLAINTGRCHHYMPFHFDLMFGSVRDCNIETLKLTTLFLGNRFQSSGFRLLRRLELTDCVIAEKAIEPFSRFPCLESLAINGSGFIASERKKLVISGPRLLHLDLADDCFHKFQIDAPKLKSFNFAVAAHIALTECSQLSLPSLEHAGIWVTRPRWYEKSKQAYQSGPKNLISILHGMKNARSLQLSSFYMEVLSQDLQLLQEQPCPLTRLQSLIFEIGSVVPDTVLDYFKGSSSMIPTVSFVSKRVTTY